MAYTKSSARTLLGNSEGTPSTGVPFVDNVLKVIDKVQDRPISTKVDTKSNVSVEASDSTVGVAAILGVAFVAGMFFLSRKPRRSRRRGRRS